MRRLGSARSPSLIVVSCVALGGAITFALLPLVLGVAILVTLVAMRRSGAGNAASRRSWPIASIKASNR